MADNELKKDLAQLEEGNSISILLHPRSLITVEIPITLSLSENDFFSAGTKSVGCDLMRLSLYQLSPPFFFFLSFVQTISRFLFFLFFSRIFCHVYSNICTSLSSRNSIDGKKQFFCFSFFTFSFKMLTRKSTFAFTFHNR